jgi:hypothetical protein
MHGGTVKNVSYEFLRRTVRILPTLSFITCASQQSLATFIFVVRYACSVLEIFVQ